MPYESEEEQVEALKKWWKENGTATVIGVAIGLVLLFGWRGWQAYLQQQAELASNQYEQMLILFEEKKTTQAKDVANALLANHNQSGYAALAALVLAHQDLEEGQSESAQAHLQWVIEQDILPEFSHIARLRLARLFLSQHQFEKVTTLFKGIEMGDFKSGYAELRGDMALAQGQVAEARTAYQEALAGKELARESKTLLQMKLDNLGEATPIVAVAPAVGNPTTVLDATATPKTAPSAEISIPLPSTDITLPAPKTE